jgi:hypothetical protein
LNSDSRSRRLRRLACAFIGISLAAVAVGIYIESSIGSIAAALPIRTVSQFRSVSSMIPLLSDLSSELELAPGRAGPEAMSELRLVLNRINASRRLIASVFEARMPIDLATLMSEIAALAAELSTDASSDAPMDETRAILLMNRASYIYSEFRDYVFRVNNDSLASLEGQEAKLAQLRAVMIAFLSMIALAVAAMVAVVLIEGRPELAPEPPPLAPPLAAPTAAPLPEGEAPSPPSPRRSES